MLRVKLRKTDRLFTRLVRLIYKNTCQKCGKVYHEYDNKMNLGVSHYFSRGRESTRFDLDNVTLLCNFPCHQLWGHGEGREDYKNYMLKRLGQEGYGLLELRANTYQKKDDFITEIVLKAMLKDLQQGI